MAGYCFFAWPPGSHCAFRGRCAEGMVRPSYCIVERRPCSEYALDAPKDIKDEETEKNGSIQN
jgi:hypothetical protein